MLEFVVRWDFLKFRVESLLSYWSTWLFNFMSSIFWAVIAKNYELNFPIMLVLSAAMRVRRSPDDDNNNNYSFQNAGAYSDFY